MEFNVYRERAERYVKEFRELKDSEHDTTARIAELVAFFGDEDLSVLEELFNIATAIPEPLVKVIGVVERDFGNNQFMKDQHINAYAPASTMTRQHSTGLHIKSVMAQAIIAAPPSASA